MLIRVLKLSILHRSVVAQGTEILVKCNFSLCYDRFESKLFFERILRVRLEFVKDSGVVFRVSD